MKSRHPRGTATSRGLSKPDLCKQNERIVSHAGPDAPGLTASFILPRAIPFPFSGFVSRTPARHSRPATRSPGRSLQTTPGTGNIAVRTDGRRALRSEAREATGLDERRQKSSELVMPRICTAPDATTQTSYSPAGSTRALTLKLNGTGWCIGSAEPLPVRPAPARRDVRAILRNPLTFSWRTSWSSAPMNLCLDFAAEVAVRTMHAG